MGDLNSKQIGYPSQFAILLGLTGIGILAAGVASTTIWNLMEGGIAFPIDDTVRLQPKYYNYNMVAQAVITFLIFFLPVLIYAKFCYRQPNLFLGFTSRFNYKQVLLVFVILCATIPFAYAMGELNKIIPLPADLEKRFKALETAREAQEAVMININTPYKYVMSMIIIALLPPIFEETFFRAGMQNLLTRWFKGPWIAIIFTSILFSLIHFSYYGFLVRFGLGVILGLLFYYSKNIWLPLIFHFLVNGLQVTAMYIMTINGITKRKGLEENFPLWFGLLALVALIYLFRYYNQKSNEVLLRYPEPVPEEFPDKFLTRLPGHDGQADDTDKHR